MVHSVGCNVPIGVNAGKNSTQAIAAFLKQLICSQYNPTSSRHAFKGYGYCRNIRGLQWFSHDYCMGIGGLPSGSMAGGQQKQAPS